VGSGEIQARELIGPGLRGQFVWWAQALFGDRTENQIHRFSFKTWVKDGGPFALRDPQSAFIRPLLAHAVGDSAIYYLLSGPGVGLPPTEPCTPANPCISNAGCTTAAPCELRAAPVPAIV